MSRRRDPQTGRKTALDQAFDDAGMVRFGRAARRLGVTESALRRIAPTRTLAHGGQAWEGITTEAMAAAELAMSKVPDPIVAPGSTPL